MRRVKVCVHPHEVIGAVPQEWIREHGKRLQRFRSVNRRAASKLRNILVALIRLGLV